MKLKKTYPLNQSPLFKITSKKRLAKVLHVDIEAIKNLSTGGSYATFTNDKDREIQFPINLLAPVHKRLAKLFACIDVPEFVTSKRGSSYVTNAYKHVGEVSLIKTDISKFYPSTGFGKVVRMYAQDFKCAPDVAWLLARLSTYSGKHLPTGSQISGYIAYLANQEMFLQIEALAKTKGCNLTCYVDDIVLSGKAATPSLLHEIRHIIKRHGLEAKESKSRYYFPKQPKRVTGCIVKNSLISLPNSRHLLIKNLRKELDKITNSIIRDQIEKKLRGRIMEKVQVLKANA